MSTVIPSSVDVTAVTVANNLLNYKNKTIDDTELLSLFVFEIKKLITENLSVKSVNDFMSGDSYIDKQKSYEPDTVVMHSTSDLPVPPVMTADVSTLYVKLFTSYETYASYLKEVDNLHKDYPTFMFICEFIKGIVYNLVDIKPFNYKKTKPSLKTLKQDLFNNASIVTDEELMALDGYLSHLSLLKAVS